MTENFILAFILLAFTWIFVTYFGEIKNEIGSMKERIARLEVKVLHLEGK